MSAQFIRLVVLISTEPERSPAYNLIGSCLSFSGILRGLASKSEGNRISSQRLAGTKPGTGWLAAISARCRKQARLLLG
jgi:hypothetical protein